MVRLNPSTFWHLLTILKIKKQNVPHEINRVCTQRPHTNICVSSSCCAAAQIYTHEQTQWHNDRKANTWARARDGPGSLTRAQRRRPNRGRNDGQTNRRTNKQTYTDTNRQTYIQTYRHTYWQTFRQTNGQISFWLLLSPWGRWLRCLSDVRSPLQVLISTVLLLLNQLRCQLDKEASESVKTYFTYISRHSMTRYNKA